MGVCQEKVFVECAVVVIVVATGGCASIEIQILVAGPFFTKLDVTMKAKVVRQSHTHGLGIFQLMFRVATDAETCIDYRQPIRVARVGKFGFGMGVMSFPQLLPMTLCAGFLENGVTTKRLPVTSGACHFNLIVSVGCRTYDK